MTAMVVLGLALAGCGEDVTEDAATPLPAADSLTPAQQRARRDSAVAGSNLPGAAGVRGAMDAAAAAEARNAAHDTLQ